MHKQFPDIPLPHLIVSVCGKLRSYRLARNLDDNSIPEPIFWLPNKPPEGGMLPRRNGNVELHCVCRPACLDDGTGIYCIQFR